MGNYEMVECAVCTGSPDFQPRCTCCNGTGKMPRRKANAPSITMLNLPHEHTPVSAFADQVGGDHYKKYPVPLAKFCHLNKIPKLEGDAIYYIVRWRDKGGLGDIDKAIHTLQLLKELEHGKEI